MSPNSNNVLSDSQEGRGDKPYTVLVEGNIGSGKTSFLNYFSQFKDVETLAEPVDKWRNFKGFNLLELMYQDPHKYSLMFQSYVQLTMLDHHVKPSSAKVKIIERSLYSARYCFVENLRQKGYMDGAEHAVISEWYDWIFDKLDLTVDLIIYLRTSPVIASARIQRRSRNEENKIPLEYLQGVHNLHEEWLIKKKCPVPAKVLELDANQDPEALLKDIKKCQDQIIPGISKQMKKTNSLNYTSDCIFSIAEKAAIVSQV
ncbi:hypothetical protein QYM36_014529 [Artemia franciscana]|uniref:Deoxynucleoside kinase domain-containing protein n=2 Tax=Artemia franciscana TaxID=6661 RepID=A0AA88KVR2_ARTSF|nr:hypothetical protein QYM36_014529 [Artemia franciscana]